MPLHVEIRVNDKLLDTLHIGRTEQVHDVTQTSTYLVVSERTPEWGWDDGVPFEHRYDEGALTCVRKAIQALEAP